MKIETVHYRRLCCVAALCLALAALTAPSYAVTYGFEQGMGHNAEAIGAGIAGMTFGTTTGGDLYYADINSGWYNVASDNGKSYHAGEYFVSGDVGVAALELTDIGRISFTSGPVSFVSIGYSSQHPFFLEAYNSSGALLSTTSGPINTKSHGDTSLQYLTVTAPNIAYVTMHDEGGYWLVDNVTVPEPSSLLALGSMVGLVLCRRRTNEKV